MSRAWSPSRLPKLRDQTARIISEYEAWRRPDDNHARKLTNLRASHLYWVTSQMAALAVFAARTLPAVDWVADRPCPTGLLVWDGGVGMVDTPIGAHPISAASWGPGDGQVEIDLYGARSLMADLVDPVVVDGEEVPPLVPVFGYGAKLTEDAADLPEAIRTPLLTLVASWLLMAQPTIADRQRAEVDRDVRRSYGRMGRPEPDVTLVDLRRLYVPEREEAGEGGRTYRHRWVVAGHWRDQPYGEARSLRRKQWIPSHLKGPDGAPLLETTRVNVWRR